MNKRIIIVGAPPMTGLSSAIQEQLKDECEIVSIDEANERGMAFNRGATLDEALLKALTLTRNHFEEYKSGKEKRRDRRNKGKQKLKVKKL